MISWRKAVFGDKYHVESVKNPGRSLCGAGRIVSFEGPVLPEDKYICKVCRQILLNKAKGRKARP